MECLTLVTSRRKLFSHFSANNLSPIVPRNILNSRSSNIILLILNFIKTAEYSVQFYIILFFIVSTFVLFIFVNIIELY